MMWNPVCGPSVELWHISIGADLDCEQTPSSTSKPSLPASANTINALKMKAKAAKARQAALQYTTVESFLSVEQLTWL